MGRHFRCTSNVSTPLRRLGLCPECIWALTTYFGTLCGDLVWEPPEQKCGPSQSCSFVKVHCADSSCFFLKLSLRVSLKSKVIELECVRAYAMKGVFVFGSFT